MKIRRSILWLCVAVAALLALLIWFARKPAETSLSTEAETNVVPPFTQRTATEPSQSKVGSTIHTNAPTAKIVAGGSTPNPPQQTKAEQMKEGLAAFNDVPIDFYGKLEDQFGNPVSDAQIKGDIRIYNGVQSTVEHLTTKSDANGLFQINDKRGESLSVMPHKDGYAFASLNGRGIYSTMYPEEQRAHPDPNNPTVIKMWKLQGAEPLTKIDQSYKLQYTEEPVYFDLLTGTTVPNGGDLKLMVKRSSGVVSQQHPQDWSVQMDAVDGGVIATSMDEARITYAAPASGYQPFDILAISTTNHWSDGVQQMFFALSRGGQVYSKVFLSFRINDKPDSPMYVTFRGVANANGSRNWEGDPNSMIKAGQ